MAATIFQSEGIIVISLKIKLAYVVRNGTVCMVMSLKPIQAEMNSSQWMVLKTYGARTTQKRITVTAFIPTAISVNKAALFYQGLFFGLGVVG